MEDKKGATSKLEEDQARELLKVKIADIKSGQFVPKGIADIRMMDDVINSGDNEKTLFDRLFDRVFPATEEEDSERTPSSEVKGMKWEPKDGDEAAEEKPSPKEEKGSPSDRVQMMKYENNRSE